MFGTKVFLILLYLIVLCFSSGDLVGPKFWESENLVTAKDSLSQQYVSDNICESFFQASKIKCSTYQKN